MRAFSPPRRIAVQEVVAVQRTWSKGVEIAFDDTGGPEPAVVLVHPAFSNRSSFAGMVPGLAEKHRVITLDLRGHGDSGVPEEPFGLLECANDVIAVCREAGIGRAVLVGLSMSSVISLIAAGLEPDLVAGVVMLDGTLLFPEVVRKYGLEEFVPALEGPGWLEAARNYFGTLMFTPFDPPGLKEQILDDLAKVPPHIAGPLMRDIFRSDYADELVAARCPLLYVHGVTPTDVNRLRELRPDALVGSVVGAGHYINIVVPEQLNAMIERFIEVLPIAAAARAQEVAG
jgi:pimeloyl-ACP methyl ester carboxylesterase